MAGFLMLEGLKECGVKGIERQKNYDDALSELKKIMDGKINNASDTRS